MRYDIHLIKKYTIILVKRQNTINTEMIYKAYLIQRKAISISKKKNVTILTFYLEPSYHK